MAMAVCVAMAFVGADGLDDCPAEPMVPKYLMGESKLSRTKGSTKLGIVWDFAQLISGPCWSTNQLYKNPNIA